MVTNRTILLATLALSGFVTSFGAHVVATNLPTYAETVGAGAFTIGMLIAVYDFAELFAKPAAGVVADRRGMKPVLLLGLVVFIVGSLLFLIVNPKLLLVVRFVQGLGAAALSTVSISLVARYFDTGRGRAFGVYNAIKGSGLRDRAGRGWVSRQSIRVRDDLHRIGVHWARRAHREPVSAERSGVDGWTTMRSHRCARRC